MIYGKDIDIEVIQLDSDVIEKAGNFTCGNESLDNYLFKSAITDKDGVTECWIDSSNNQIIAFSTLACSAIIFETYKDRYMLIPAVEVKNFALNEKYQNMPYEDDASKGVLADYVLADLIISIIDFTDYICGASRIILHSTPGAHEFYIRNKFKDFEEFMIPEKKMYLEDCIPMFLNL